MPKDQYRETDVARKISHLTFGVESAESIQQYSHMQVVSKSLYTLEKSRVPMPNGVLDRRLGTSSKDVKCETCGLLINECAGHFGHIDLELPVFHVGFFRSTITILQSICKRCARVLLPEEDKNLYRSRLSNPNLSYMTKKAIHKKITNKCKKISKCPYCKEINGTVKKLTTSKGSTGTNILKILYEKNKGKDKEKLAQEHLDKFNSAIETNSEIQSALATDTLSQIMTPIDVLRLFERIPQNDIALLAMDINRAQPKDLIYTRMPVPPVTIRPSVVSDFKGGTNEDDLTAKQSEIALINDVLRKNKMSGMSVHNHQESWNFLQLQTALFINSELSGVPYKMLPKKPGRGVVQRLKGKHGRFRGNLSAKRVDFSGRTVISPDPNLQIDQVGVPIHIAKILTYPERVTRANIDLMRQLVINGPKKWPGANYVLQPISGVKMFLQYVNKEKFAQNLKLGDIVERHLCDDDIVLFNRQPSLHKLSIMAHRAKIHRHRTLRFNECVCNPYNADFDGDEMNLHLPQTEEAKAEAFILMGNKNNLVTPRNGELLIAATQDFLTGAFRLTRKGVFLDQQRATQIVATLLADKDVHMTVDLPTPCILKPRKLWSGKQIFSLIFRPNRSCPVKCSLEAKGKSYTKNNEFCDNDSYVIIRNSELIAGSLDKSHLGSGGKGNNIFYVILRDFGQDQSIKCMWRLARLASFYLMNSGFSIGIGDVTPSDSLIMKIKDLLNTGNAKCDQYITRMIRGELECRPGLNPEETLESFMLKELSEIRELAGHACLAQLHPTNSPIVMVLSGSKGSVINISQMISCVGQQALNGKRVPDGFENRSLPHFRHYAKTPSAKGFVENSFYTGLIPTEFFFHTMGGREGLVDTAVKTAETGYMQRRLIKSLEDLVIHYDSSVRNADRDIIQFNYGCDNLDPTFMEGKDCPVDFNRVLRHVQAKNPYRDEVVLNGDQIKRATETLLEGDTLNECSKEFKDDLKNFMDKLAEKVDWVASKFESAKVIQEIERITCSQLVTFVETCAQKYSRSIIEPGTPVGALASQSIGEPGTQMTLKTFHFAGVQSMNITQGVPRIKEIINASKKISTPVIMASLTDPSDFELAKKVKARIEKTTLGQIALIEVVYASESFLLIELDLTRIKDMKLEVNADTVRYSILTAKLKLKPTDVRVENSTTLTVHATGGKNATRQNFALKELEGKIPNVMVKGLATVNRAVIAKSDKESKPTYNLFVEGDNFRDVIATYGVDGNHTVSNNIMEVYNTLGIEAAREKIMKEINLVMENHGMSVDYRHVMLLAAQMTHTGEVLGITRYGVSKMKQSVLNLASFEKTADHLFDAAYYGQTDKISGVSENIIMGMPCPVGTGIFDLLHKPSNVDEFPKPEPLLFETAIAE